MTGPPRHEPPDRHDLYQLLGVDPGASGVEVTRAYRRLARLYHPDVDATTGAAQRFHDISRAHRVLSDPLARARYDADRAPRKTRTATGARRESWSPWATSWTPRASMPHAVYLGADTTAPPVESEEAELDLTLEECCQGTTRTVTVTSQHSSESVHVAIPAGVIDGDRIEVPTTTLRGGRKAPSVFLRVRVAPHQRYQRDGRDLHMALALSPWEAALGTHIAIDTPSGLVQFDVPAGTSTGHLLTLPGRGIPHPTGPPGDLYAQVRLVLPAQLTGLEQSLFRRLATVSTFDPRASDESPALT